MTDTRMYTRCPNCSTIFRVSAAQLRVALGEVNCGSCHETFNALSALTEDLPELTEVVVLDPAKSAPQSEDTAEPDRHAPDSDDSAVPLEVAGQEASHDESAGIVLPESPDEASSNEQQPGNAWAEPDDVIDVEIGVETDVNDDLIDTVVDDTPPAESSEEPFHAAATDDGEPETPDDSEPTDGAREAQAGEPRYDDNTGIEEILTGFEDEDIETAREESAAGAWAGILAEVHEDDLAGDRRQLEADANASRGLDDDSAGVLEPAYDDHTGIEEILHEGNFADHDDSAERDEGQAGRERDDLEFDAPEQSWSEIFSAGDTRQPPVIPAEIEPDSDQEQAQPQAPSESLDLSPLSALESETADPDEWANLLSELGTESPDEQTDAPPSNDGRNDAEAEPTGFDYDEANATEIVLSSSDPLPVVKESVAFADSFEPEYSPPGKEGNPVDQLIDYEPEFVPPWESDPAEHSGEGGASIAKLPRRKIAFAALLILALGIQLLHYNRDSIARHASWGPRIQSVYSALGSDLYPDWNLDSYRITGSEAVAGRSDRSALDIVANVTIAGDEPVSLPLVRVALQDRWGNAVASRVFKPNEYLSDVAIWPDRLAPGTTIPIDISVADPGSDAHGYIVDICLPHRTAGLQCQIQTEPFRP
ncbi:MAG: DUF3426 domain-containing protein [Gammaproteobacteria bacterium]